VLGLERLGQVPGGPQAGGGVGVVEGLGQFAVDEAALGLGQVVGDISALVDLMETSS
jgi:hypothetical protein